jgi:hypothetical protein
MKFLLGNMILLLAITGCATRYKEIPTVSVPDIKPAPVKITREPFGFKSSLPYIAEVAKVSNCIINNDDFVKEVEVYPKFTHTALAPAQVAERLKALAPVVVTTYQTKNPWSNVIATTYSSDRVNLYFNTRKNPRDMKHMVNTSFHEALHLNGFSHGDNSPVGKGESVNYRVGLMAEKYVKECQK